MAMKSVEQREIVEIPFVMPDGKAIIFHNPFGKCF